VRIVATADVPPVAREAFAALGEIEVIRDGELERAEVLIVRGAPVGAVSIQRAARLRVIARTGAGYDNVDVDAATRAGIPVVYAPEVGSRPIAEGTVALILAAAKRLRELGDIVQSTAWESRYGVMGLDLEGACVGIVGLGAIGRRVASLCRALGMVVIAHDPAATEPTAVPVELVSLTELVTRADVITLHCALTERTRGLVDRALLSKVKPGAVLVNAARGAMVESEDVLAEALASGRLSAVALDVHPSEPPRVSHRLYSDPRVISTPHSVGLTQRWNEEVFACLADGVSRVLAGDLPPNLLNPEALATASARCPPARARGTPHTR
jgi:D-3-phosphoglycerate dehydrogenase / 2-oxoglutarate reductase